MLFHTTLLFCLLTSVVTNEAYSPELNNVISSWPSSRYLQKRQAEVAPPKPGQSEKIPLHVIGLTDAKESKGDGKTVLEQASEGNVELVHVPPVPSNQTSNKSEAIQSSSTLNTTTPVSANGTHSSNATVVNTPITLSNVSKTSNSTASKPSYQPDLSNPGVMKRGLIVFGAFALMAVAYFIFYRRKSKNIDSNNTHGTSDTNQFRYGVLQSDDRRDNLELSRIPLTMESDEDEDEDLEIFDLEQKKKSLSYVNLQTSDDYVVHESGESGRERNNLLLDIEDANSDTLINWSSNGNKSIL